MKQKHKSTYGLAFFLTLALVILVVYPLADTNYAIYTASDVGGVVKTQLTEDYGKLPLCFICNEGQVDSQVEYYLKASRQTIYITLDGIVFNLLRHLSSEQSSHLSPDAEVRPDMAMEKLVFSLDFNGANPNRIVQGREETEGVVNYLIGKDPAKWHLNIPVYHEVAYEQIYDDIDLRLYIKHDCLNYDFIIRPGGNVSDIEMTYNGTQNLQLNNGELLVNTGFGIMKQLKPNIYQEINGKRVEIEGNFRIINNYSYGFEVGGYCGDYPLIIDPTLMYSTYLGGTGQDFARDIAIDSSACAYITGFTNSTDFPTVNAYQTAYSGNSDIFITKLSSEGNSLIYSTYIGGSIGGANPGQDDAFGIAVDSSGYAYVVGETYSTDFPTQNPIQPTNNGGIDTFVLKLSTEGNNLIYSTYLGGVNHDFGRAISIDSLGYAYVTGSTRSTNFPIKNAYQSTCPGSSAAFVSKLSAQGDNIEYSTYLGGSGGSDQGNAISVDSSGCVLLTGNTRSSNFPTINAFQSTYGGGEGGDAFVTRLSATGNSLLYSTFLGGSGYDSGYGIPVDLSGCVYIAGFTYSTDFPTLQAIQNTFGGGQYDAFVTKINPALSGANSLIYSTYLGGSNWDFAMDIDIDSSGCPYTVGETGSNNFPTMNPLQNEIGGGNDVFVTKISAEGTNFIYSTFLGGSDSDCGYGIAVDSSKCAHITGFTDSSNFPVLDAFQNELSGFRDVFIAKLGTGTRNLPEVTTDNATNIGIDSASLNGNLTLLGSSPTCSVSFQWGTRSGEYPNETAPEVMDTIGPFAFDLTGLNPGTFYCYRAKVVGYLGHSTDYGVERSFTTIITGSPVHNMDTGEDFQTIQAAIYDTDTDNGHTITVEDGTYIENVHVNKSLTIRSTNGVESTMVTASNCGQSVFEIMSDNVTIEGFTIQGATAGTNTAGIHLYYSNYCHIFNNKVTQNLTGILLRSASNNTVSGNAISNSDKGNGLEIYESDENQIIDNVCINNWTGINMRSSSNNLFRDNHSSGNHRNLYIDGGHILADWTHDIDTSNTVDGKPICYWVNQYDKQVPTNTGYVAIVNSDNITIKDLTLANNARAVSLIDATHCTIENLIISNCDTGVRLLRSSHNNVRANHIDSLFYCGILLYTNSSVIGSDYNTISENVISNCYYGIAMGSVARYNLITENTIILNTHGVSIPSNFGMSGHNTVSKNMIAGNYSGEGWGASGIVLRGAANNTFVENIIMYNESGVLADPGEPDHSTDNLFYNNDFIDNVSQTYNFQEVNIWDNGLPYGGNYWSDYTGEDANNDGIGDIPYEIIGGTGGVDNYPLMASRWKQSIQNVEIILEANPKSITTAGSSTSAITATVKDDQGNNLPDDTVVVFVTSAGSIGSTTAIELTTNGIATAALTSSSTDGVATVTATVGSTTAATAVFFTRPGVTVTDFIEEETPPGQYTIDAKSLADIEVIKWGDGTPTVTVAKYSGNPAGPTPGGFSIAGEYVDVHFSSTDNVTKVEIRKYYTDDEIHGMSEATLRMHWWSGSGWVECSNSGVNTDDIDGYSGYVWAIITDDTTPSLADLTGAMFAAMEATTIAPSATSTPSAPRASPTPSHPLNPEKISTQYLNINPQHASTNQPVTIITNVVNTGGQAGNHNVILKINGKVEQAEMVSVGPYGTQPVKFTVTKTQPGTYTVDIGGQKSSFTIRGTYSSTPNASMIVLLIAALIVGLLSIVIVMLFRSRAW